MANITFGNYSPAEDKINTLPDIVLGIFFDGTLNNKQNTKERESNTAIYKKNGIKTWKENKISEKKDSSYDNDNSNIARMSESCIDKKYPIYIEGIGTLDKQKDDQFGYAMGSKTMGIRKKVMKGCDKIVAEIVSRKKLQINTLTLDVFGFSRGAAAARNFVYEISKKKYPAIEGKKLVGRSSVSIKTDDEGNETAYKELPAKGYLGLKLKDAGIVCEKIIIRFLGIYDTVSSYDPTVDTIAGMVDKNFDNDVYELRLNDIYSAKNVVHFVAKDEHRENFDITHTLLGEEKLFPGVHSDIGGSYLSEEEWVREIATDWVKKSRLKPIEDKLIAEGWYNKDQLSYIGGKAYFALVGKRMLLKTYSYIPLNFMVRKANEIHCNQILIAKINEKYDFSKDLLLSRVGKKLEKYVFNNGKPYDFKWFHEINKKYNGKETSKIYLDEINEQKDLRTLRNKYLHWSADRYGAGMDPRWNWVREHHYK